MEDDGQQGTGSLSSYRATDDQRERQRRRQEHVLALARSLDSAPAGAAARWDPPLQRIMEELWRASFGDEDSFDRWLGIYCSYLHRKIMDHWYAQLRPAPGRG